MMMRFGVPQCVRCTMVGHLSHQCGKPILPYVPPTDEVEDLPEYDNEMADLYVNKASC